MAPETRRQVLVADDDPDVRRTLAEYLTTRGCEVLHATNGLEALLQVKRARPNAVVLDVQMPRLGGLEAIPRIRAFDPSIGIVLIADAPDARLQEEARKRGASAVFVKPLALPELAAAIAAPGQPGRDTVDSTPPPAAPTFATQPGGGILIVDDDPGVSDVLLDLVRSKGYQVRAVADAASALREVAAAAPDIVLLDINMPGLDGVEALPAIRALAPRTVVIMVSGTTNAEVAKRALAYGAFDYVTKPVDIAYLAQSIETAFTLGQLTS